MPPESASEASASGTIVPRVRQFALHPAVITTLLYLLVTWVTHAHLTGDGPDYAREVRQRIIATNDGWRFWDAGHLIWRPLAFSVLHVAGALGASSSAVSLSDVGNLLIVLSWIGGAACVVLLPLWLKRVGVAPLGAFWATVALMTANAFLGYFVGGTPYMPGLACLLAGLYLMAKEPPTTAVSVGAGLALGFAVLLWLPYILALPAALCAPSLLHGPTRERVRASLLAIAACAVVGLGAYGAVVAHLGITNVAGFAAWFADASHGITHVKGLTKAVFGFSRSFINMGLDGAVFKRFLLHDPYNPVSLIELFRTSLIKFGFFYLVLAALAVGVWKSRRGIFPWLFCATTAIPVLAFAVAWQGGDTERYLPLYPVFLLALGLSLGTLTGIGRAVRLLAQAFVVVLVLVNIPALSKHEFTRVEDTMISRVDVFNPSLLPATSLVVTPSSVDGLAAYLNSGATRKGATPLKIPLMGLVTTGVEDATKWRERFSQRALESWDSGGRVWVSRRALSPRPARDWGWVEGDDPRFKWADFARFFTQLDQGVSLGGTEGYVEILHSEHNRGFLRSTLNAAAAK
jgi:hypothetical protein